MIIHARDLSTAEEFGVRSTRVFRAIRAVLGPAPTSLKPRIVVFRGTPEQSSGITNWHAEPVILINQAGIDGIEDFGIAHELAHWCFDQSSWRPAVALEEGVADFIALQVAPQGGMRQLASRNAALGLASIQAVDGRSWEITAAFYARCAFPHERIDVEAMLALSREQFVSLDRSANLLFREAAFRIVARLGHSDLVGSKPIDAGTLRAVLEARPPGYTEGIPERLDQPTLAQIHEAMRSLLVSPK